MASYNVPECGGGGGGVCMAKQQYNIMVAIDGDGSESGKQKAASFIIYSFVRLLLLPSIHCLSPLALFFARARPFPSRCRFLLFRFSFVYAKWVGVYFAFFLSASIKKAKMKDATQQFWRLIFPFEHFGSANLARARDHAHNWRTKRPAESHSVKVNCCCAAAWCIDKWSWVAAAVAAVVHG